GVRSGNLLAVEGWLERGAHRRGNRRHRNGTRSHHAVPGGPTTGGGHAILHRQRTAAHCARDRAHTQPKSSRDGRGQRPNGASRSVQLDMAVSVVMPALELAQETGKILSWIKKEGDSITKGEPLVEIETDKITFEVEAPADGVLAGVRSNEGEDVPV